MKIKHISLLVMLLLVQTTFSFTFAQAEPSNNINGRYLIIDDISTFFRDAGEYMVTDNFQLYNILENESSKPVYVGVTELINVVKFSIESGSSTHENQRRCKLTINKTDYLNTFRLVLSGMEVKYIIHKEIC